MKNTFTALLLLAIQVTHASGTGLLEQLSRVNSEWQLQKDAQPALNGFTGTPQNYNEWIAAHLLLVEQTLRSRDVCRLSDKQKENRYRLLDSLRSYSRTGVFPVNDYLTYKSPVFIDRKGTHCAVGYLMQQSGHDNLARQIDVNEKFAYVKQIKTAGVKQWADEFGFTVEELAWIQPTYPPSEPTYDLDHGLNATVNAIVADTNAQIIYAGGAFTESISGAACGHIAAWISGFAGWDWVPVGDGLNGTVYTLLLQDNKLYAGGDFTMAGSVAANHIAVYDISSGQWEAMGSLDSTVRALAFYNGNLYAAGNFTGFAAKWTGSAWQDITQGFIYGEGARTLQVWDSLLVIGGNFELATGALRQHVATYNGTQMGSLGFGTITPVNDFEFFNGKLFAACDSAEICALATFDGTDWNVHLKNGVTGLTDFEGSKIMCLQKDSNGLLAGGSFSCFSGMTFGNDLMKYYIRDTIGGVIHYEQYVAISNVDSTVNAICLSGPNTFFGGEFTSTFHGFMPPNYKYNHIANLGYNMSDYTGIAEAGKPAIKIYPNPVSDLLQLKLPDGGTYEVECYNLAGELILHQKISMQVSQLATANLPAGVYILRATNANASYTARIVKE